MYPYLIALGIAWVVYYFFWNTEKIPTGKKKVPVVAGSLPIVGHGITFSKDIIGFIRNAREKYGDVFRIKIFRKDMVVCCDHGMKDEFFRATEDEMSLYDVLKNLFFADAFADDASTLPQIIDIVKSTIKVQFDDFAKKIVDEASKMVDRMKKNKNKSQVDLIDEMIRFVACTSARCFIGMELDDEFYKVLIDFTHLVNKIVILTYFVPKWLLRLIFNPFLKRYRVKMINKMIPEIKKYREDPHKKDSLVFHGAVDYVNKNTGMGLNDREVGEVVICLLYVSSENTALGLSATMIDLANNPKYWDMVKNDSKKYLLNGDIKSLFASPVLDACAMESARMNSHVFALDRKPKSDSATFGDYYIGKVDCIAMCEPMMMMYDCSPFKDSTKYNPDRFLGEKPESKLPKSVMTWGAGVHMCPGKGFAIYEIKTAMALITNNFERFNFKSKGTLNYFSPSAFSERSVKVSLTPLPESESVGMVIRPVLGRKSI